MIKSIVLGIIGGSLLTSLWFKSNPVEKLVVATDTIVVHDTIQVAKLTLNHENLWKVLKKHNIPHADIVFQQALLETGHFQSRITYTHQNIFGMRTGKSYTKYNHWEDCVIDYKNRISSRYKSGNYYNFLTSIGYAENKNYIKLLKRMNAHRAHTLPTR